jgi:hypothetical protein
MTEIVVTAPATWASVRFAGYTPDNNTPFVFNVGASDEDGNCIHSNAGISRDAAVSAALDVLAMAACLHGQGLNEVERQKLRDLAEAKPWFGNDGIS